MLTRTPGSPRRRACVSLYHGAGRVPRNGTHACADPVGGTGFALQIFPYVAMGFGHSSSSRPTDFCPMRRAGQQLAAGSTPAAMFAQLKSAFLLLLCVNLLLGKQVAPSRCCYGMVVSLDSHLLFNLAARVELRMERRVRQRERRGACVRVNWNTMSKQTSKAEQGTPCKPRPPAPRRSSTTTATRRTCVRTPAAGAVAAE